MIYATILVVFSFLFFVDFRLSQAVDRLETKLKKSDDLLSQRLWQLERMVASQEAAFELQEIMLQNHERALQNSASVSIMHAQACTEIREEVRKLRADRVWYGAGKKGVS